MEQWPDIRFDRKRVHIGSRHFVSEYEMSATTEGREIVCDGVDVFSVEDGRWLGRSGSANTSSPLWQREPRRGLREHPPGLVLLVLRQVIGDLEPGSLRADEDVLGRTDARRVDQRAHRDVHVGAVAHD